VVRNQEQKKKENDSSKKKKRSQEESLNQEKNKALEKSGVSFVGTGIKRARNTGEKKRGSFRVKEEEKLHIKLWKGYEA